MEKKHWVIKVSTWGTMYGYGTEEEAEQWRIHKARWEQSVATKRLASPEEIAQEKWEPLD